MKRFALAAAAIFSMTASYADVYKWVDENGNVHFGDRPPEQAASEEVSISDSRLGTPIRASAQSSATGSADSESSAESGGKQPTRKLCARAAGNFRRFLPELERLAMDGAKAQASAAEIAELKSGFAQMRKVSSVEFTKECIAAYDTDPEAKAMADCFGNSDDVMMASLCMAFSSF